MARTSPVFFELTDKVITNGHLIYDIGINIPNSCSLYFANITHDEVMNLDTHKYVIIGLVRIWFPA